MTAHVCQQIRLGGGGVRSQKMSAWTTHADRRHPHAPGQQWALCIRLAHVIYREKHASVPAVIQPAQEAALSESRPPHHHQHYQCDWNKNYVVKFCRGLFLPPPFVSVVKHSRPLIQRQGAQTYGEEAGVEALCPLFCYAALPPRPLPSFSGRAGKGARFHMKWGGSGDHSTCAFQLRPLLCAQLSKAELLACKAVRMNGSLISRVYTAGRVLM